MPHYGRGNTGEGPPWESQFGNETSSVQKVINIFPPFLDEVSPLQNFRCGILSPSLHVTLIIQPHSYTVQLAKYFPFQKYQINVSFTPRELSQCLSMRRNSLKWTSVIKFSTQRQM